MLIKSEVKMTQAIKNIYLFRHGETDWNREKRVQGHINIELNSNGKLQAIELAEHLKDISFDIFYSSDLVRAHHTAIEVSRNHDVEIQTDPRLREAYLGKAQGMTVDEIIAEFGQESWDTFRCLDWTNLDASMPGGETRRAQIDRFLEFFDDIIYPSKHQNIGIASHGGVLRNIIHFKFPNIEKAIEMHNCCCYRITIEDSQFKSFKLIF